VRVTRAGRDHDCSRPTYPPRNRAPGLWQQHFTETPYGDTGATLGCRRVVDSCGAIGAAVATDSPIPTQCIEAARTLDALLSTQMVANTTSAQAVQDAFPIEQALLQQYRSQVKAALRAPVDHAVELRLGAPIARSLNEGMFRIASMVPRFHLRTIHEDA
jgi:hypothetical protein